ncbi:IS3 family transposase [Bifidobacterium longum]|uniref:IS3 family transposase n=1 Tax=Bifidobacterium longum TaxID=216816 RepID=UPI003B9D12C2
MKRPDKDSGLLELVREAFENSKRRYGYKRIHLELKGMGIVASAKRIMRLMTRNGLAPLFKSAKRYSSYTRTKASPTRRRRTWWTGISTPNGQTCRGSRTSRSSRSPRARPTCRP